MNLSFLFSTGSRAAGMSPSAVNTSGNRNVLLASIALFTLISGTAQAVMVPLDQQTFPYTFNTGFTEPAQNVNGGNFLGKATAPNAWKATTSGHCTIVVKDAYPAPITTNAIKFVHYNTVNKTVDALSEAASPVISLAAVLNSSSVTFSYKLHVWEANANDPATLKLEFWNGTTWNTIQTLTASSLNPGSPNIKNYTFPIPAAYRIAGFKYRFSGKKLKNKNHDFYVFVDDPTISYETSTLPVELISFNGAEKNGSYELSWTTASEINFKNFEVERSNDGINYSPVGVVNANGTSGGNQNYSFTDLNVNSTSNLYYRLRMNDIDGAFKYSKVVVFKLSVRNGSQSLYPVPAAAGQDLTLSVRSASSEKATLQVIDVNGRVMGQSNIRINNGTQTFTVPGSRNLKPGAYILVLTTEDGEKSSIKFIAQ